MCLQNVRRIAKLDVGNHATLLSSCRGDLTVRLSVHSILLLLSYLRPITCASIVIHLQAHPPLRAILNAVSRQTPLLINMTGSSVKSSAFLAETNDPTLDQRVSIAFILIDTFFLLVFYASRYYNPKAVGLPMLVCNTLCYVLCLGSATAGICKLHLSSSCVRAYRSG